MERKAVSEPINEKFFSDTVLQVLQLAKRQGADAAEVAVSEKKGFSVVAHSGDVETIEHLQEKSLSLTVFKGNRSGAAGTRNLSKEALMQLVDKACAFAKHAGEDPESGLPDPDHLARHYPDLSLYHPWELSPKQAIEMAIHCEQVAREQDERIMDSDGVGLTTYNASHVYANSHDFLGAYPLSYHHVHCGLIAKSGKEMHRDYEYTAARDPHELDDPVVVAKRAAEKTVMRLNAKKIKTQRCPIIFEASIAKGLLSAFISAISGGNLYRKSSFLLDHLDKRVFPEHVHIYQQPHLLKAMGSAPFDSEGVKTEDRDYVKDGLLTSYVLSSYSARKLGMEITGNAGGVYNLFISHSDRNLKKLFSDMGTGFFVTDLIGQGVNILTGDYSRGAAGFWIENGEIQHPVHEVTIAGNLKDMFQQLVMIANDVDHRGNTHTGSMLFEQMMLAGE